MSVRMYSNPLPLSSHDLPRMLWKASGKSREHLAKRERRGWGAGATWRTDALTSLENSYPIVIA